MATQIRRNQGEDNPEPVLSPMEYSDEVPAEPTEIEEINGDLTP